MGYDVIALGEVLIDFVTTATDGAGYPTLVAHPGGAPANFLATLAKFGAKTAFFGKVGADAFGHMLRDTLAQSGIDTEGLRVDPDVFTTLAFVTLDRHGERAFSFARKPGADTRLRFEELDLSLLAQSRALHFGTLSLTHEPARTATREAVAYAKGRGLLLTFDPNLRPMLWENLSAARAAILWGLDRAHVVKLSEEELFFLFGEDSPADGARRILREYDVQLVFVTLGRGGCYAANLQGGVHVPALGDVTPVDTTGAGDIFGGSAVWKLLQSGSAPAALTAGELREITRFACTAAGLSVTRPGGISAVPPVEEVYIRMEEFYAP